MSPHATPAALSLTGLLEGVRAALTPERAARVWTTTSGEDSPVSGQELLVAALGRLVDSYFDASFNIGATHVLVHAERTRSGLDLTLLSRPHVRTESPERAAALTELRRLGAFLAERDTSAGETCTFVRIPAITALGDAA